MYKITVDGNEACARASYMFTQIAGIYPITPSSTMPELIDKWSSLGKKNIFGEKVKVVEMQSEAGAIGMVHGSLQAGLLTSTYTASQGLLLMIPNMYKIAGEMLPCTIHVAARSLATHALSIFGDHQDVYAARMTGFCMLSSSSVQDAYYLGLVSHLSSIKSSLPFVHFFDGFRTSHEYNKINIFDDDELNDLLDKEAYLKFKNKALNINNPVTRGTNQNGDIYFQHSESRNIFYDKAVSNVSYYMDLINKKAGTNYKPFNYYGSKNPKKLIIAMGSVCETIKETIDYLNEEIGLIIVRLYRPFSSKLLLESIPSSVTKIAVLDRTKEAGSSGEPLYLDVLNALKGTDIKIVSGRYGLSSKDTTPGMIKAIYDMLDNPKDKFTIGIDDDVTNLSLPYEEIYIGKSYEMLIYGYGSDGMVSASKSIISMVGDLTDKYVQGYFEYDSKKSGGVTCSHLRFSDNEIRQTYFVTNPKVIVISKDTYLSDFDPISNISDNGIVLINTNKNINEILKPYKKILKEKNVSIYTIDADEIASKYNLNGKISMIMETAILFITDFIENNKASKYINDFIENKFSFKGQDIVNNNINACQKTKEFIKLVTLDNEFLINEKKLDIYSMISSRQGNKLKVSDFLGLEDGTFKHTKPSSTPISNITSKYLKENCIQCGMCCMVCPHGVIRPFLLDNLEYEKAPESIKNNCIKAIGYDGYFTIGISKENCTGCGVCINTCPGKKGLKALVFDKVVKDDDFDYLTKNVTVKNINPNTIKGCQLREPKFAFSGACAGCGETAYIKLLTQIFGDNLIIANATGCSSIYGASIPDIPYSVAWANSLFEDNAEFGYGILTGYNFMRENIYNYVKNQDDELCQKLFNNFDNYEISKEVYDNLNYSKHPYLKENKNYIIKPSVWSIGGDGWAYDIGFSGIDHVLSSGDDVNILVLDSGVYSNTGGQSSKATPKGAVAKFASNGKSASKKDLAKIAMCYPNTYVAGVSLGANMLQVIKAFKEAENHNGPSIVIAYCPCISHGIKGGMANSVKMESLAVKCGYFPIFRYDGNLTLDSTADFDLYDEFLNNQTRFTMLKKVNPDKALEILKNNKEDAMKRYEFYKSKAKH